MNTMPAFVTAFVAIDVRKERGVRGEVRAKKKVAARAGAVAIPTRMIAAMSAAHHALRVPILMA